MAFQQRLGSVNLFQNRDKKEDKHPDFKGSVEVQVGDQIVVLDIAMWERKTKNGDPYFGANVKVKTVKPNRDVDDAFN